MGVRLYNPTRGLFTSLDPVPGGSATAYAYPYDPRSYGYDGTDNAGKTERRGLVTSLTVSRPGTGGALTWTADYTEYGTRSDTTSPDALTGGSRLCVAPCSGPT